MSRRIYFHIGAPKSGTTYLQSLLWLNREELRERGLLFPGHRPFDQNRASLAVRGDRRDGSGGAVWQRFVQRAREFDGDVMLSNEWYVEATAEQIRGAVDDMATAGEVHVVFTARDLVAQIPAGWQETLKLGTGLSLDGFVERLDDASQQWCWRSLDAAEALEDWAAVVPAERIHVVTVPRSTAEPDLLWRRFLSVPGVDAAGLRTDLATANESLGVEAARLLQEFGPALLAAVDPDNSPWQEPYDWLRNYIAHEVLVPLGGRRIGVGDALGERLRARSAAMVDRLLTAGYDLVGDTADLLDGKPRADSVHPDDVPAEAVLERAEVLTARLLADLRAERKKTRALEGDEAPDAAQRVAGLLPEGAKSVARRLRRKMSR